MSKSSKEMNSELFQSNCSHPMFWIGSNFTGKKKKKKRDPEYEYESATSHREAILIHDTSKASLQKKKKKETKGLTGYVKICFWESGARLKRERGKEVCEKWEIDELKRCMVCEWGWILTVSCFYRARIALVSVKQSKGDADSRWG